MEVQDTYKIKILSAKNANTPENLKVTLVMCVRDVSLVSMMMYAGVCEGWYLPWQRIPLLCCHNEQGCCLRKHRVE